MGTHGPRRLRRREPTCSTGLCLRNMDSVPRLRVGPPRCTRVASPRALVFAGRAQAPLCNGMLRMCGGEGQDVVWCCTGAGSEAARFRAAHAGRSCGTWNLLGKRFGSLVSPSDTELPDPDAELSSARKEMPSWRPELSASDPGRSRQGQRWPLHATQPAPPSAPRRSLALEAKPDGSGGESPGPASSVRTPAAV